MTRCDKQLWGLAGQLIARGYQPHHLQKITPIWVVPSSLDGARVIAETSLLEDLRRDSPPEVVVIFVTMLHRGSAPGQLVKYQKIMDQIGLAGRSALCLFSLQFEGDRRSQALRRISEVISRVTLPESIKAIGLCIPASRKTESINCTLALTGTLDCRGIGWVDDDVELEDACFTKMIERFRARKFRGAVGPTKIPHQGDNLGSRLLFYVKKITLPAANYPHGCCILVSTDVLRGGIPSRYVSDDGYVCFSLLRPSAALPTKDLEVLRNCACHYVVGAPKGVLLRRIKRLLINHFVFICDYPAPVGRYYLREMMFHGFWPIGRFDWSRGVAFGLTKWGLKLVYFSWFSLIGFELFLRGLVGLPIRTIPWGGGQQHEADRRSSHELLPPID